MGTQSVWNSCGELWLNPDACASQIQLLDELIVFRAIWLRQPTAGFVEKPQNQSGAELAPESGGKKTQVDQLRC